MTRWLRRGLLTALFSAVVLLVVPSSPASAHAELLSSTPSNGASLSRPPADVTLTFTESVHLIDGAIRLLDGKGHAVSTPSPTVAGHTVRWPMPKDLADGRYLVDWRVISADGHPVAGAFAFGVGVAAGSAGVGAVGPPVAPLPVVLTRFAGYLAFSLLVGVVAFVTWCSPASRKDATAQLLARVALVGGVVTTLLAILVQGPYVTGRGWGTLFDSEVLKETAATPFGEALLWRLALFGALGFAVWMLEWLEPPMARWLAGAGIVATAATYAAAGHAASSGRVLDLGVDTVHVMAAGTWVGGLTVLALAGRSVERRAYQQFSTLAMASVLALVASGVVNSLFRIDRLPQLWETRYGVTLLVKLAIVAVALGAAALSRRTLHRDGTPARTVRVEAAVTVVVLAATAVLTLTTPPATVAAQSSAAASGGAGDPSTGTVASTVQLNLGAGRTGVLQVSPATTAGSRIGLTLFDRRHRPLAVNRVKLQMSMPFRGIDNIDVPLRAAASGWTGDFQFPVAGKWLATLTVEDKSLAAVVAAGNLDVRG
jgi:copper transport protein